jgi:hypothetical protein
VEVFILETPHRVDRAQRRSLIIRRRNLPFGEQKVDNLLGRMVHLSGAEEDHTGFETQEQIRRRSGLGCDPLIA